jgi:hypothetical protein
MQYVLREFSSVQRSHYVLRLLGPKPVTCVKPHRPHSTAAAAAAAAIKCYWWYLTMSRSDDSVCLSSLLFYQNMSSTLNAIFEFDYGTDWRTLCYFDQVSCQPKYYGRKRNSLWNIVCFKLYICPGTNKYHWQFIVAEVYGMRNWYLIRILDIKNSNFLISRFRILAINNSVSWHQEFELLISRNRFVDTKNSNSWYQEIGILDIKNTN